MADFRAKAFIKRATIKAQQTANQLDLDALNELQDVYLRARTELSSIIRGYADSQGSLRLLSMRQLLNETDAFLEDLSDVQAELLKRRMKEGAELGAGAVKQVIDKAKLGDVVNDSLLAARTFVAEDGLQLSDRIWRINNSTKEAISRSIQMAIVQGQSASEAAQQFIQKGLPVPIDIKNNLTNSGAEGVIRETSRHLINDPSSAYNNARRLFRTEVNRAHTIAYENSVSGLEDFAGTRFLLSPLHPEVDICDMHAKANVYGLGNGVYPKGKNPCPAHPNTLSYTEVVFIEEVSDQDASGKISREAWLRTQPRSIQEGVLGGRKKQQAFAAGLLKESQYRTSWRLLKKRFEKQGVNTDNFIEKHSPPTLEELNNPFTGREVFGKFKSHDEAASILKSFAVNVSLNGANLDSLTSIANGLNVVLSRYNTKVSGLGWVGGKARNVHGLYTHYRGVSGNDGIYVNKRWALKGREDSKLEHAGYLAKKERTQNFLKEQIKQGNNVKQYKLILKESIVASRWSVSTTAPDPVFATIAHEAGHAVFVQNGLNLSWIGAINKYKVTKIDMLKVSEYAASNLDELFSEVTSLLAMGYESQVPERLLKAYKQTVDTIGG